MRRSSRARSKRGSSRTRPPSTTPPRDRRVVDRRRLAAGPRQPRPCVLPVIDIAGRARRREPVVVAPCFRGGASQKRRTRGASGAKYPCFRRSREFEFPARRKKFPARPSREFSQNRLESLGFSGRFFRNTPKREKLPADFPVTKEQPSRISTWPSGVLRCRRLVYVRRT
jgi:hypothetical protein